MATNTVGIDKEVEVDRKENLRDHRLYWIGRRTQDVILSSLALVVCGASCWRRGSLHPNASQVFG